MPSLSAYEQRRTQNIKENNAKLRTILGDFQLVPPVEKKKRVTASKSLRKRKKRKVTPSRRSRRTRGKPPPNYSEQVNIEAQEEKDLAARIKEEKKKGYRLKDGTWRGERFGEIKSVKEGTVFGHGDYQRLGRREMCDTGFFRPFVTPEWINPKKGCYAIILNNDNPESGSKDNGSTFEYAGAGGRHRGQNRTAPQSFHQSWASATNAALKKNYENKIPVRVIRGPKLRGKFGTRISGGGFRYDGLYLCTAARLKPNKRGLNTAMFTFEKIKK
eukprot:g6270.t1